MRWKDFVADWLEFSRKERIAILILAIFIVALLLLPRVYQSRISSTQVDTSWFAELRQLEQKENDKTDSATYGQKYNLNDHYRQKSFNATASLFYFDPNTLPAEGWKKLGVRDRTIKTILRYIEKGGRFKTPEDLQKIYGLSFKDYDRLIPFVRIPQAKQSLQPVIESGEINKRVSLSVHQPRYSVIDINSADTSGFIALPGIGSKLALRIVTFREKLGGFYSIDQVAETYGLPDSTFQKIISYLKLETMSLKKININTATVEDLAAHPYIKWHLARPIISFRETHGKFIKLKDVLNVMAVNASTFEKIKNYLTVD